VYDAETGEMRVVSTGSEGEAGNSDSGGGVGNPIISANASSVLFSSAASNLVDGVEVGLFIKNLDSGEVKCVLAWHRSSTQQEERLINSSLSSDARYVAYESTAGVFLFDQKTSERKRIDVEPDGSATRYGTPSGAGGPPSISADGRFVSFTLEVEQHPRPEVNTFKQDVYLKDMKTGQLTRASTTSTGQPGNRSSFNGTLSPDGNWMIFSSWANDLSVAAPCEECEWIYRRDNTTGRIEPLAGGLSPTLSANGRYLAYVHTKISQVHKEDKYIRIADLISPASDVDIQLADDEITYNKFPMSVSDDGQIVAFNSDRNYSDIEPAKCVHTAAEYGVTEVNCRSVYRVDTANGVIQLVSREEPITGTEPVTLNYSD